jgi:N-acetylglucosamine-6-phosphate deacetylase
MLKIETRAIYIPEPVTNAPVICIDQDRIVQVGENCASDSQPAKDFKDFDLTPGFIELQINGAFGEDFSNDPGAIWRVAARLPELGITTVLPTIITSPAEAVQEALAVWKAGPPAGYRGARIPGLHLEGPFLNPLKKGAHREQNLRLPSLAEISNWTPENGVRMVTLAPEMPGALSLIRSLSSRGVLVSAGHSMASTADMELGIDAGIRFGTHMFNAMRPLDHRDPGIAGLLLSNDHLKTGIIVDGIHVAPDVVRIIYRCKKPAGFFLVSDAMAALGMSPGRYQLAGREVQVNESRAVLEDGTLAGSILTPAESLRNFQRYCNCDLSEALVGWTTTPAAMLGVEDLGILRAGAQADMVFLDDHGRVAATMIAGDLVYQAPWAQFTE